MHALTRRAWLLGMATAVTGVGGCAAARTGTSSGGQGVTVGLSMAFSDPGLVAAVKQALPKAVSGIEVFDTVLPPTNSALRWWLVSADHLAALGNAVNLGPALQQINFNPGTLLPGTSAYVRESTTAVQVMPNYLQPLVVRYNADAFDAAGLTMPSPTWTLEDFETACAALDGAIQAGRLKALGVDLVLYPMLDQPVGFGSWAQATLGSPLLWEAFVAGYGGAVASGTQVRWDSGGALEGVTHLLELFRRYGATTTGHGRSAGGRSRAQARGSRVHPGVSGNGASKWCRAGSRHRAIPPVSRAPRRPERS